MDVYGLSAPDGFGIDDLLDFSNDEIFTPSTSNSNTITTTDSEGGLHHHHLPYSDKNSAGSAGYCDTLNPDYSSADFTDDLGVPNDDIAELEWLSNFVDDSFAEFPANSITGTMNVRSETPLNSRSRSKRFRSTTWTSAFESATTQSWKTNSNDSNSKKKDQNSTLVTSRERSTSSMETVPRKCTHCASEKTPQWRTGPLGPKTLCNACGVRYKSGRLVPEYRPAASPTFVLTQHSNSHRKVLELRRQKELLRQQQQQQQQQLELYGHQHRHFQVC